jgi:hypothetical protein
MKRNINSVFEIIFFLGWLITLPFCAAAQKGAQEPGKLLEMTPIVFNGLRTDALPVGWQVFEKQEDWEKFWSQNSFTPAPEIDFDKNTLVAIFLGQKPNPGYSVKIESAREYAVRVVVQAEESEPAPGAFYIQLIVYPYDAVVIPKTGKPLDLEVVKKKAQS